MTFTITSQLRAEEPEEAEPGWSRPRVVAGSRRCPGGAGPVPGGDGEASGEAERRRDDEPQLRIAGKVK